MPGSPGWGAAAFLPTPGHSRPSHRQFSALGPRLPVAVTITICKALPADAPRADPTARRGRAGGAAPGVPGPGLTVSGGRGPPGASQLRQGGGGGRGPRTPRGACDGGAPALATTPATQPGARREVEPLSLRYRRRLGPRTLSPAGRGVVPVPAAAPAPGWPRSATSFATVLRADSASRCPPQRPARASPPPPSQPSEPLAPAQAPWRSPQSPRATPLALLGDAGALLPPARSACRPPPSSPGRGPPDSPQNHQLPVFHRLLVEGAVLLLAGGKHGALLGRRRRRRRRLRRDPRRVRAAATIPSREGSERAGEGHGGEGGAGRPIPRLLRRGCAAALPGSPELRAARLPRAGLGNKWNQAAGGPTRAERRSSNRRRSPAGGRKGKSKKAREGRGQRAGEGRGPDRRAALRARRQVGAAPPSARRPEPPRPPGAPSPGAWGRPRPLPAPPWAPRWIALVLCKHRVKGKGSS